MTRKIHTITVMAAAFFVAATTACNRENYIYGEPDKPEFEIPDIPAASDDDQVLFAPLSYIQTAAVRYTYVRRKVVLEPIVRDITTPEYVWTVDGKETDCTAAMFSYTPTAAGKTEVCVKVKGGAEEHSARMIIVAVERTEMSGFRSAGSKDAVTDVFEYTPAPGQFVGETYTPENAGDAAAWAKSQLDKQYDVSLGSFGGTIVAGFDHSIASGGREYDFVIVSNAFNSPQGDSNEPGVVWVMQDVNGNGEPDDMWYQIRGSEYDKPDTHHNFAVTYTRPADGQPVPWATIQGRTGTVPYMAPVHKQPNYYPAWIKPDTYTLYGTCLPVNGFRNEAVGNWSLKAYGSGYADNMGSDIIKGATPGSHVGFKISDAVHADGTPVDLKYIDFVKIQTAVLGAFGPLGEESTEVSGIYQYK